MSSTVEKLAADLRSGATVFSAWCGIPEPSIAGVLAREAGYGAVVMEMQHSTLDSASAMKAIPLVAAAGKPAIARIPVGAFDLASRFLDAGASGIIAPMINSVEDAKAFVSYVKFPPLGQRSWGPQGALTLTGLSANDYFAKANGFSIALAMIETQEALDAIDDILAVDGIDGIFIGPSDLSIGLSRGAKLDPFGQEVTQAIGHAARRAKAAGKLAGIYAMTGERAAEFASLGYGFVAMGSDLAFLKAGAASFRKAAGA